MNMGNNVIQFDKDYKFYFKKASSFLNDGKITKAIEYFLRAKEKCRGGEIYILHFMLAQAYFFLNNLELSSLYYFLSLKEDLMTQSAMRGLGENFAVSGDVILARFYLNGCANLGETLMGQSAKERLKTLENLQPKFLVLNGDMSETPAIESARKCMSEGKFEDAISLYEKSGNLNDDDVRSELSLAYFFENNTEKSLEILQKFGSETVSDLCNFLLVYHAKGDQENYDKTLDIIRNKENATDEEKFKIALALAQTRRLSLALVYMEDYLYKNKTDTELEFYYILALINDGQYEKAKRHLINLKKILPFDSYLFDHYIEMCNAGTAVKLDYAYALPVKELSKIQTKIKSYLVLNNQELKNIFLENQKFFYYYFLKTPPTSTKNLLLVKLAGLEGDELNEFFDVILLSENIAPTLKNSIAIKRASLENTMVIAMTKDNVYIKIILPNMQVTRINNIHLHSAVIKSLEYILSELPPVCVTLSKYVIKLERRIKSDNVRDDILACYLSFDALKNFRITTLNKICRRFKVLQQELYKFLNDYNLEV